MSFSGSIPNIGDFLAISQKQMNANFQAINNTFSIDHIPYTSLENEGKHDVLTMRPQMSDPTTSATQIALYNKLVSSLPQLFFRPSSDGTPIQLTNSNMNTAQTGSAGGTQSTFLAGPFTVYMGYVINCPNNQVVNVSPSSTLVYVGLSTFLEVDNQGGGQTFNTAAAVNISSNHFIIQYPTPITANPNPPPSLLPANKFPTIYYLAVGR